MINEAYLNRIVAEELMNHAMEPLIWLEALEETEFSDDGATKKAYLRLRLMSLRAEEDRPLVESGLAIEVERARRGDLDAQNTVGAKLLQMGGVTNYANAVRWFRRAADEGSVLSRFWLGSCYSDGKGVQQDYSEALKWYLLAAEQEHSPSQCALGALYARGLGVPQDFSEAVKWYRFAAEQGDPLAQLNLGAKYLIGQGVVQDFPEAVKWYRLAAEQGLAGAQYHLGNCYSDGQGVPQDYKEAINWYRLAAEQGDRLAQHNLGAIYSNGQGVPKDYREAVNWYRLAAEQGLADSQFMIGRRYAYGQGVPQDHTEAAKWYRLAAEQGLQEAEYELGVRYVRGSGVTKDLTEAAKWYGRAERRWDPTAVQPDKEVETGFEKLIEFQIQNARFVIPSIWVYVVIKKGLEGKPIINEFAKEAAVLEWIESLGGNLEKVIKFPNTLKFVRLDSLIDEAIQGNDIADYLCPSCGDWASGKYLRHENWLVGNTRGWKAVCPESHEVVSVLIERWSPAIEGYNVPFKAGR